MNGVAHGPTWKVCGSPIDKEDNYCRYCSVPNIQNDNLFDLACPVGMVIFAFVGNPKLDDSSQWELIREMEVKDESDTVKNIKVLRKIR